MWKLIYYEMKKHFNNLILFIIIFCFMAINIIKIFSVYENNSFFSKKSQLDFKEPYNMLYEKYSGEITEEKIKDLMGIYIPIKMETASRTISTERDENSYTYNKYSDEIFLRWCFVDEMQYDYMYQYYANNVARNAIENMKFFYDKGNLYEYRKNYLIAKTFYLRKVSSFFNSERYQYFFYYDFSTLLMLMLITFGLSTAFVKDKESEMEYIILTTRNGRMQTRAAKMISASLFILIICIIFLWEDDITFKLIFGGEMVGDNPLYSLKGFRNTPLTLTIRECVYVWGALKVLGMLEIGMFILFLSKVFKKTIRVIVVGFTVIAGLIGLESVLTGTLRLFNPILLFSSRKLFFEATFTNCCGYPVPDYIVCIFINLIILLIFSILILYCERRK